MVKSTLEFIMLDVRAPECTGQASGTQVGGCGAQGGAMCASTDSMAADISAVWLPL